MHVEWLGSFFERSIFIFLFVFFVHFTILETVAKSHIGAKRWKSYN